MTLEDNDDTSTVISPSALAAAKRNLKVGSNYDLSCSIPKQIRGLFPHRLRWPY